MKPDAAIRIELKDEAATARLAEDVAVILGRGDVLALSGDLGAGKSTFARALLRAVADDPGLEVPSPTFTLVQPYGLRLPIGHFDLYRLTGPDELDELGLDETLAEGAAVIEWPEKAGAALPEAALWLAFEHGTASEARIVTIDGPHDFRARLKRSLAVRAFLEAAGHGTAARRHLQGDASSRAYEAVRTGGRETILMNAPEQPDGPPIRDGLPYSRIAHLAENVTPFVAIAGWLRGEGFSAPEVLHADLRQGILLIEDLGRAGFLSDDGAPILDRYLCAVEALAALHGRPVPATLPVAGDGSHTVPRYDRAAMLIEAELLLDWYLEYRRGTGPTEEDRESFLAVWNAAIAMLAAGEESLVLRDYHSPNLIWREERDGLDRLGIIDFQDAMIGPAAYDVASLVQDARVTIEPAMAETLVGRYVETSRHRPGFDEAGFRRCLAIMQAQRASKILGIFVRLDKRDHKPAYLAHLPRIRRYLSQALRHPDLTALRHWYQDRRLLEEAEDGRSGTNG